MSDYRGNGEVGDQAEIGRTRRRPHHVGVRYSIHLEQVSLLCAERQRRKRRRDGAKLLNLHTNCTTVEVASALDARDRQCEMIDRRDFH